MFRAAKTGLIAVALTAGALRDKDGTACEVSR